MHGLEQKLSPNADRYSSGWREEDFVARAATPLKTFDYWNPASRRQLSKPAEKSEAIGGQILSPPRGLDSLTESVANRQLSSIGSVSSRAVHDWWNPLGAQSCSEPQRPKPIDRWFEKVDLPEFNPDSRRIDWSAESFNQPLIRDARSKAKWIVAILQPASLSQRAAWLNAYEEVFLDHGEEHFFRKMRSLAGQVDDPEILIAAITVKEIWRDRLEFQQRRSTGKRMGAYITDGGILSWPMALRIAVARRHHDPSTMIDPEWLDDWRGLRWSAEGYWSFSEYAVLRAESEQFEDWQLLISLHQEEARWSGGRTTPINDVSGMSVTNRRAIPAVPATLVKRYKEWCEKHDAPLASSKARVDLDSEPQHFSLKGPTDDNLIPTIPIEDETIAVRDENVESQTDCVPVPSRQQP